MPDVNGTRSHALLTSTEWTAAVARADRGQPPGAVWNDTLGALTLRPDIDTLPGAPGDEPSPDALRAAAARAGVAGPADRGHTGSTR